MRTQELITAYRVLSKTIMYRDPFAQSGAASVAIQGFVRLPALIEQRANERLDALQRVITTLT